MYYGKFIKAQPSHPSFLWDPREGEVGKSCHLLSHPQRGAALEPASDPWALLSSQSRCLPPPSLLGPTFSLWCKFLILAACCREIHLSSGFVPAHPNSQAASAFTPKWPKWGIFEISIHLYATPFEGYGIFAHLNSKIFFFFLICVYFIFLIYACFICILYSKYLDCIFYISALCLSSCRILVE